MLNLSTQRKQSSRHCSFLVRLWQDGQQMAWRALAQSVQTGEIIHFADLESLFVFLQAQTIVTPRDNRALAARSDPEVPSDAS